MRSVTLSLLCDALRFAVVKCCKALCVLVRRCVAVVVRSATVPCLREVLGMDAV